MRTTFKSAMFGFVLGALALNCLWTTPAHAQFKIVASCPGGDTYTVGAQYVASMDVHGTLCTAASVSASITGFTPATTGTPISVTTGGVTGSLPAGTVVVASNVGTTNIAYCKLGASATTSDQPISPNGGWFAFTVGAATQLTCITSSSTTSVNMVGGAGLPTGTGGGGGGSGGSGTSSNFGSAYPAAGTAAGFTDGTNMAAGRVGDVNNVAAATNYLDALGIGRYNATQPTLTDTRFNALQLSSRGELLVSPGTSGFAVTNAGTFAVQAAQSGTWNITNVSGTVSLPTGAATAANQATEISSLATIATNTGAAIPACLSSPCTTVIGAEVLFQGTAALSATNGLFSNILQGNAVLSATNGAYTNVLQGNAVLSATNPTFGRSVAGATGGGTLSSAIAPATPAGVNLKASAGSVFRVFATTIQSTPVYIKFYNASSAPTCGSGTPVGRFMVPVAATAANGAGTNIDIGDMGAAFGTGIGYCVTGALADNDTTAITANNTLVNIVWN